MAKVIEERFVNWQGQDFDENTLEPSDVAQAIMEYLDCECTYFPSMKDDDPIMSAYSLSLIHIWTKSRKNICPMLTQQSGRKKGNFWDLSAWWKKTG